MVLEFRLGQISDNTRENGKEVSIMVMENSHGLTGENTSGNSSMTKNTDTGYFNGLEVSLILEHGKMEYNMEKA